jgi:hypothetical protein
MHAHHTLTLPGADSAQLTPCTTRLFSASTMDIPGALPAAISVGALLRDFFLDGTS